MDESKKPAASGGDDDKMMAALSCIPIVGLIVFFAMKDASDYVRNYARQGALLFLFSILGIIPGLNCIVFILMIVALVMLVLKAWGGDKSYKLPLVGDLAYSIFK